MVRLFFVWIWVWCSMVRVEDSLVVPPLLSSFIFHETQLCTNDSWIFWFLLYFQAFLSPYLSAPWNWLRGALDSRITTRGWQHRWFHENDAPQGEYFRVERKTWVSIAPLNTCKCIPLLSHSHQTHCFIPTSTHTHGCNSSHVTHSTQIPHWSSFESIPCSTLSLSTPYTLMHKVFSLIYAAPRHLSHARTLRSFSWP